jgi:O-antigen/teichoic acid export membrane protein
MPLWYGTEFQVDRVTCVFFSASCIFRAWRYANHALVVGIGKLRPSTGFTVIEVVFSAGFILIGAKLNGLAGVFAAQAIAILLFSGWGFPWLFWRSGVRDKTSLAG